MAEIGSQLPEKVTVGEFARKKTIAQMIKELAFAAPKKVIEHCPIVEATFTLEGSFEDRSDITGKAVMKTGAGPPDEDRSKFSFHALKLVWAK